MFEGRPYNGDDYPENPQAIAWKKANEIDKKKLKVNYRYNVEKFLHDTKL